MSKQVSLCSKNSLTGCFPKITILNTAVRNWKEKEGNTLDKNGKSICKLSIYTKMFGVPYNTLVKYVINISVPCTVGL